MNIIDLATKALQLAIQTAVEGVKSVVDVIKPVVDATKTKVDTMDTNVSSAKTTTETVNTNIGAPTSAANNATIANAHAKLNWLTTNVGTLINGRVVKSVQRGVADGYGDITLTISPVNTNKSIAILHTNGSSQSYIIELTSTKLRVLRQGSIDWQVIEFY